MTVQSTVNVMEAHTAGLPHTVTGFIAQNLICTSQRSRLPIAAQDMLLRVQIEAPTTTPREVTGQSEWNVMKGDRQVAGKEKKEVAQ